MQENDGNSYFFFTAVSFGLGAVAVAIQQAADNLASRIAFTAFSVIATLLAIANIISLFVRIFVGQKIEVTPPFLRSTSGRFFFVTPWRIARLLDCAIAWIGALALILMCFWIWDDTPNKHLYFSFCNSVRGCKNIWDAWLTSSMHVSELFTASTTTLELNSAWAVAYKMLAANLSFAFNVVVAATVVAEGYARIQDQRKQEDIRQARAVANGADPERGSAEMMPLAPAQTATSLSTGWYRGDASIGAGPGAPGFHF